MPNIKNGALRDALKAQFVKRVDEVGLAETAKRGVSKPTTCSIRSGDRTPSAETLVEYLERLGCKVTIKGNDNGTIIEISNS